MAATRIVPDSVWAQLDPSAGRLSRRERRTGVALAIGVVVVLGLAVLAYLSGVAYPRVNGDMRAIRGSVANHQLDVRVRVSNPGWVDQHVAAVTVANDAYRVIATDPISFVLPPGHSRTVTMRIRVRSCSTITDRFGSSILPVAVVVHHWWGHESHVLFSDDGNSGFDGAGQLACHRN